MEQKEFNNLTKADMSKEYAKVMRKLNKKPAPPKETVRVVVREKVVTKAASKPKAAFKPVSQRSEFEQADFVQKSLNKKRE